MSPSCPILQVLLIQNAYLVPAAPRTRTDGRRGQTAAWRPTQTGGPSQIAQKRRDYATEPQMKPAERSRAVLNGSWYTPYWPVHTLQRGGRALNWVVPNNVLTEKVFI